MPEYQYENLQAAERRQLAENSVRELEAQHFQVCIQITANKGIKGNEPRELEQRKSAIEQGLRNLRREYAALLAEPVEPQDETEKSLRDQVLDDLEPMEEPQRNGHALHAVGDAL